jgi:hypothetical protein
MTEHDVLNFLKAQAKRRRFVSVYARELKIPQPTLSAILLGDRPLNDVLLAKLGLERVVQYRKIRRRV